MRVPRCSDCGEQHMNFVVCAARKARREAEADAKKTRLEHDAPGVRRFGDATPSWQRSGETLWLANPHPKPSGIRVPDEWNDNNDEPPRAA